MSLVTSIDSKKKQMTDETEVLNSLMRALELLVRGNDQLDEQLHAGYFFYMLSTKDTFFAYDQFVWAFTLAIAGIAFPVIL